MCVCVLSEELLIRGQERGGGKRRLILTGVDFEHAEDTAAAHSETDNRYLVKLSDNSRTHTQDSVSSLSG